MERLVDLMMEIWDVPVFQFAIGLLLGLMTVGTLWLLHTGFKASEEIEDDEKED